ncbi:MAG: hypothetical protein E7051_08965 [Lentisphaerae bacterium]|nr:hypothetical protein [Lentisphaerota bacterium]
MEINEKVQKFMDKIDSTTEKYNFVSKFMDYAVDFMKKPQISCISPLVNKITSKLSLVTAVLFAVFYVVFCLKNMVICFFFEDAPYGMAFFLAIAAIVITLLGIYIIDKMSGILDNIITTSQCRISSLNYFSIITLFFEVTIIISFFGGIYMAVKEKSIIFAVLGIIGAFFSLMCALYSSSPENFSVVQDKKASAGEDLVTIIFFGIKTVLRLIPIITFLAPIIGICLIIPEIFETYTYSDFKILKVGEMVQNMIIFGCFLLVGMLPLVAYINYLTNYIIIDIIRAILSLPQKLDKLADTQ